MKQVINTPPDQYITPAAADRYKYYGFRTDYGTIGYIGTREILTDGESYNARFFQGMTQGNTWFNVNYKTLAECIDALLSEGNGVKVFEFDSWQELFKWAIKE